MKAGAALYSAELRHVMSQSDRRRAFFLCLSPKSYSMRSSPTADSCVSFVYLFTACASCRQFLKLSGPERIAGGFTPTFGGFGGVAGDQQPPVAPLHRAEQINNLCRSVISAFTWLSKPPPSVRLQCVRFATVLIAVIARLLSGLVAFQWHSIVQSR